MAIRRIFENPGPPAGTEKVAAGILPAVAPGVPPGVFNPALMPI